MSTRRGTQIETRRATRWLLAIGALVLASLTGAGWPPPLPARTVAPRDAVSLPTLASRSVIPAAASTPPASAERATRASDPRTLPPGLFLALAETQQRDAGAPYAAQALTEGDIAYRMPNPAHRFETTFGLMAFV